MSYSELGAKIIDLTKVVVLKVFKTPKEKEEALRYKAKERFKEVKRKVRDYFRLD